MAPVVQNIPLACRKTVSQGIFGLSDATNLLWKRLDSRGAQIQDYLFGCFSFCVDSDYILCGTSLKDRFISVHRFEAVYVGVFFIAFSRTVNLTCLMI